MDDPERQQPTESELERLRQLALEDSADARAAVARQVLWRYRSEAVRRYVLGRADGLCEGCQQPASFVTAAGEPYLEAHHLRRLSDGGRDDPIWVAAVCANCHRRAHHAIDAAEFNQALVEAAKAPEPHVCPESCGRRVRVKFDDNPPVKQRWSESTSLEAVFAANPAKR